MRAQLIHSPSLWVSAEGVYLEVKENLKRYERHVIIVPERQTLISEKQLLKSINKKCAFECEVISINRLCNRVFGIGEVLDKQGGTMLVQKILQEKEKELVFFKSMQSLLISILLVVILWIIAILFIKSCLTRFLADVSHWISGQI